MSLICPIFLVGEEGSPTPTASAGKNRTLISGFGNPSLASGWVRPESFSVFGRGGENRTPDLGFGPSRSRTAGWRPPGVSVILAGEEGIEPSSLVLETNILPLYYSPTKITETI